MNENFGLGFVFVSSVSTQRQTLVLRESNYCSIATFIGMPVTVVDDKEK